MQGQGALFDQQSKPAPASLTLTFRDSLAEDVHRWYPYVEGFSAPFIRERLAADVDIRRVYDPFGGAGTTQLVAACLGVESWYSEVNPFMAFVAETKVNAARWARGHLDVAEQALRTYLHLIQPASIRNRASQMSLDGYHTAFPGRDYFVEQDLQELLAALSFVEDAATHLPPVRDLLRLACAANAVRASNMTRRADLRRRRSDEYKKRIVDVSSLVSDSVQRMLADLRTLPQEMATTTKVSDDCRAMSSRFYERFDVAITSPPYLNGTNYFRNTKIELWLLGFISSERELGGFRRSAVAAGINNVVRDRPFRRIPSVERHAQQLDDAVGDPRIPLLIRQYFSDMRDVLLQVWRSLVPGGRFHLDIGDSKFYGVHIPTDELLAELAEDVGFRVEARNHVADRLSYDKSPLTQVELVFRRDAKHPKPTSVGIERKVKQFGRELPHLGGEYARRGWGHPLHSLCSYQGKLKSSLAHWIVKEFVPRGGRVLDPLGGVGTVAFEAALVGSSAISNDKSPLAALVASAKLDPPTLEEAESALHALIDRMASVKLDGSDRTAAQFGLNAQVADYYHSETLQEVLKARRIFLEDRRPNKGEDFVWASLLHVLHGNRPYALSRTSHPVTPFHPSGPKIYKSLEEKVRLRIRRALGAPLPGEFRPGLSLEGDFRFLPDRVPRSTVDVIVTSPPFIGMRFDRPNWLRLWFTGWSAHDFHVTSLTFLEREQLKSTRCYEEFFAVCHKVLIPEGLLILHVGSGGRGRLVESLRSRSVEHFSEIGEVIEDVRRLETHGIRDKGLTKAHHLLFLRRVD
jgi:DNA modification methylase